MLFNATHAEELRVAIVDGQKLLDLDIESAVRSEKKGNIYKAVVTKVEPSLEAAFVNYGAEKHGFLPLKEIYREYFQNYDSSTSISNVRIDQVIREGQEMVVQVDKDERGTKGAALTTFISLAGRFLVLMPNNPKGGGISRRISGEDRSELRDALANLEVQSEHALIARTAGIGRSPEELQWDLDFLTKLWASIHEAGQSKKAPFLIYQESNLIVRTIRDHLSADISEIIVDDEEIFERAQRFMHQVMPHNLTRLKLYKDTVPLFSRYQIESQIDSAFNREVSLPSGGSIVIDHTEALISVDVNSARATKGGDIEETAFKTNLEAVDEVARQLRIRDIGGLVVIDLIDMTVGKNQRSVENRLKEALKPDRARVQIGKISRFGLLEMSRQRLRSSISDANYHSCPRCSGTGTIRSVVSSSLNLLRLIEDEALKENTEAIQIVLPLDMATYLLNEKRHELNQLEARLASRVIIIPSDTLQSPHFELRRLRSDELDQLSDVPSYKQEVDTSERDVDLTASLKNTKPVKPSIEIEQISHTAPPAPVLIAAQAPVPAPVTPATTAVTPPAADQSQQSVGLLRRITRSLFGNGNDNEEPQQQQSDEQQDDQSSRRGQQGRNAQRNNQGSNRRGGQRNRGGRGGSNRGRIQEGESSQAKGRRGNDESSGRKQQGQGQRQGQGQGQGQKQGQKQGQPNRNQNNRGGNQGTNQGRNQNRRRNNNPQTEANADNRGAQGNPQQQSRKTADNRENTGNQNRQNQPNRQRQQNRPDNGAAQQNSSAERNNPSDQQNQFGNQNISNRNENRPQRRPQQGQDNGAPVQSHTSPDSNSAAAAPKTASTPASPAVTPTPKAEQPSNPKAQQPSQRNDSAATTSKGPAPVAPIRGSSDAPDDIGNRK